MIHPTAVINPGACLGDGVRVDPYACIGAEVEIGDGTRVGAHAVILGPARIGRDNRIHAHACLGDAPQDLAYRDQPTRLEIGDRNTIREFVSIHRGTPKDRGITRIGSDNLLMVHVHVGHDCEVGDGVILANGAMLGGHVVVESHASLSALTGIHQFARIGRHAMIGAGAMVTLDIPPYVMAAGDRARLYGLNRRGLRRAGFTPAIIGQLERAYRLLYRSGLPLRAAIERVGAEGLDSAEVAHLLGFLQDSRRGVTR